MQEYLREVIEKHSRKIIFSRELEEQVLLLMGEPAWERAGAYEAFADAVEKFAAIGFLCPVKASGSNGRTR